MILVAHASEHGATEGIVRFSPSGYHTRIARDRSIVWERKNHLTTWAWEPWTHAGRKNTPGHPSALSFIVAEPHVRSLVADGRSGRTCR